MPSPFGPMIATRSPRRTMSETRSRTRLSPYAFETPSISSTSRPLCRSGVNWKSGARREVVSSSPTSIFSICLRRLCACRALVAFAPKRSTQARFSATIASARAISRLLALADRRLLGHERGVVAGVRGDRAVVDVEDVRRDVVEEALVVRDDDRAALVAGEELLEPADREDVEVVGRLVEEQHVRPAEEHLREEHAQLEAAGERRERLAMHGDRDAEPLEDGAGARLERVAVVRGDPVLELGQARRVGHALGDEAPLLGVRAETSSSPAIATSRIGSSSRRKRSCRRTPTRASLAIATLPSVAGSSPATISRNVVLPDPFAPTRP